MSSKTFSSALGLVATAAFALSLLTPAEASAEMKTGKVGLRSIGALAFGPDGVLFAGDSEGAAVYAIDISPPEAAGSGAMKMIEDLDEKIASLLGTRPRDVRVQDMVVHRPSGTAYLSVLRGKGDDALPVLLSITRGGEISEVPLDNRPHAKLEIKNAPAEDAKLYSWQSRTFTITDLEFIDGELFIAGLSNEEFASALRRVPYPFTDDVQITGLEIYHGAHGEYETFAPIFSFIPYELAGKPHLLAGYLCTPLVTFPLDELREKSKLRGKTIAELGWGNIPTDLIAYEKDGDDYVLVINNRRGTMRIKGSEIEAAQKRDGIVREVGPRSGLVDETVPLGHVAQAADYDSGHILILGRDLENGSLYLQAVGKHRV